MAHLLDRNKQITKISQCSRFDMLIIGGGIHGANIARMAGMAGLSVAMLEKYDYASATSSRSSKMAHGGLRYLEMGDLKQVFEGIRCRERLFENFSNLVKPHGFLIPIEKNNYFQFLKMKIGLFLYDLLVRNKDRRHKWIPRDRLNFEGFDSSRKDLLGCFMYTDGILSDCRLVLENIHQARSAGALCLNYAEVESVSNLRNDQVVTTWRDALTGDRYQTKSKVVINCAGPWAPYVSRDGGSAPEVSARYSRGTHLIFDKPWKDPALFLPMEGDARYYFVWPHFAGTLVGTTESEVTELESDPQPTREEVEEVLSRLASDLPNSGLTRDSLHYAFAGVRTLPLRGSKAETGRLSRKHIWDFQDGLLTLVGGKLTTAEWTAWEGLQQATKISGLKLSSAQPPVFEYDQQFVSNFLQKAKEFSLSEAVTQRLLDRYGARAVDVLVSESDAKLIRDGVVFGELRYAIEVEQAETPEDILRRRLELEYLPGSGLDLVDLVVSELMKVNPGRDYTSDVQSLRSRLTALNDKL